MQPQLNLTIPATLKFEELVVNNIPEETELLNHLDKLYFVLDFIYLHQHVTNFNNMNDGKNPWLKYVELDSQYWNLVLGKYTSNGKRENLFHKIITICKELNILESDNCYVTSKYIGSLGNRIKCKGYRFTSEYRYSKFYQRWCTSEKFENKILSLRAKELEESRITAGINKKVSTNLKLWIEHLELIDPIESFKKLLMLLKVSNIKYEREIDKIVRELSCESSAPPGFAGAPGRSQVLPGIGVEQIERMSSLCMDTCQSDTLTYHLNTLENRLLQAGLITSKISNYKKASRVLRFRARKVKTTDYTFDKLKSDTFWMISLLRNDLTFDICDFGYRLHTIFTRMPARLRGEVMVNGKRLVGADIANSQPCFLALVLMAHYKKLRMDVPADVKLYIELCLSGKLYEHIMSVAKVPAYKRPEFKTQILARVLFNKPPKSGKPHWIQAKVFKHLFPSIWNYLLKEKIGDFRKPCQLLQRMESSIMVNKVCGDIFNRSTKIPIITLHDAIYTTQDSYNGASHIEIVIDTIKLAFEKKFGVLPTVAVSECKPLAPYKYSVIENDFAELEITRLEPKLTADQQAQIDREFDELINGTSVEAITAPPRVGKTLARDWMLSESSDRLVARMTAPNKTVAVAETKSYSTDDFCDRMLNLLKKPAKSFSIEDI